MGVGLSNSRRSAQPLAGPFLFRNRHIFDWLVSRYLTKLLLKMIFVFVAAKSAGCFNETA
jgi:hypothetical protein